MHYAAEFKTDYNASSLAYYVISYKLKLTAARLKKGTAQSLRLANSARTFST